MKKNKGRNSMEKLRLTSPHPVCPTPVLSAGGKDVAKPGPGRKEG